jgi:hypothetical protein
MRRISATLVMVLFAAGFVLADVRTDEKSQVKFEGTLGRMVNFFGGRGAREGIVSTVAVKGNRKMMTTDKTAQLVDLAEEKVYELDLDKKSYMVMTFAEIRRQMEEARRKAAQQAQQAQQEQQAAREKQQAAAPSDQNPQVEIDFDLKESGQKKAINGFDAREVVMTVSVHEKGKPIAQNGGMVLTSSTWLTPKVANAAEIADFDRRYAEKLGLFTMVDAQQMAAAVAMYPMMADAMKRMQAENVRLDGTPVLTVMKFDAVAPPDSAQQTAKQEPKQENTRPSFGGIGGALARRALNKKDNDKDKEAEASAPATPGRVTIMTIQHELLKVTPTVSDADVAIPAGFKVKS